MKRLCRQELAGAFSLRVFTFDDAGVDRCLNGNSAQVILHKIVSSLVVIALARPTADESCLL